MGWLYFYELGNGCHSSGRVQRSLMPQQSQMLRNQGCEQSPNQGSGSRRSESERKVSEGVRRRSSGNNPLSDTDQKGSAGRYSWTVAKGDFCKVL